jgi:hypothetical protein
LQVRPARLTRRASQAFTYRVAGAGAPATFGFKSTFQDTGIETGL